MLLIGALFFNQAKAQQHKNYQQKIEGTKLVFDMQAIPAGEFLMGSKKGNADELPVHNVKLDAFYMSKVEVTWDIFEPFLYKDYEKSNSSNIPPQVDAVTRPTKPYLDMTFGMGKQKGRRRICGLCRFKHNARGVMHQPMCKPPFTAKSAPVV